MKNSLMEKHNVHRNIARDLNISAPKYEINSQSDNKSTTNSVRSIVIFPLVHSQFQKIIEKVQKWEYQK